MQADQPPHTEDQPSSLSVGDVTNGIHGSILAGRDAQVVLNIIHQQGTAAPSLRNLPALLDFLRRLLPQLTHPAEKATAVGKAAKPIAAKLAPLVEKLAVAAFWVGRLWLGG